WLVDNAEVGAIEGDVSFESGVVPEGCMPNVYVFSGDVNPDDVESETEVLPDVDPLTVVRVDIPEGATQGTYRAAFIPAGEYTVAFSCSDDTDADEALAFVPEGGTTVT